MRPSPYSEDRLVQQTTADYIEERLGWKSIYAHNAETFGSGGTLGRESEQEVVLARYLREALEANNPHLPTEAYDNAIRAIVQVSAAQSTLQTNREKYDLLRNGVKVSYRDQHGGMATRTLRVFDFTHAENNHFLVVRELWIKGPLYRRRADIVGFVNGVPLLFMELKNIHRNIRRAYDGNLADYKDTIAHIFHHNAFVVLGNGVDARIGSYAASFEFFRPWKRLDEDEPGIVDMETLLKGVCTKANFLDLFENFVLFDDSSEKLIKVVAQNQQYLGVNRAVRAIGTRGDAGRKLGVFWHTQGAGKSYSMVFFSRKVHRTLGANFTFLVLCDRDDLDNQIYRTYAGCGVVSEHEDMRADSGQHLKRLLGEHKAYVFSLIQKFNQDVMPDEPYSDRADIIVVVDEAHRTQYGRLAFNQRNALPNAGYIAFTGTPLMQDDEITRRVFGDYVSRYGFQRAVEDSATVPLFYDARGEKLGIATAELNERIAAKLDEMETLDIDVEQRLEQELRREYHIITAPERLAAIARDFVTHYTKAWESGKAMFIAIDKITAVKIHELIGKFWQDRLTELEDELHRTPADDKNRLTLERQFTWMKETKIAVVISEEQGEVGKFRHWELDIMPHRKLIKNGFETADGERIDVESAFKQDRHPFRVAIVCAMWLTGFDVKSLATLYLDKPLKAHTLMQAIARANRVHEDKNNGLIVDYCGILKNLRGALATFAGHSGEEDVGTTDPPARPQVELLQELRESLDLARSFLIRRNFRLEDITEKGGFARNAAIVAAKEIINENDETRKRFEIIARTLFRKFKACLNVTGIGEHYGAKDAVNIIYRSLQEDREQADISQIIKELHGIVGQSIDVEDIGNSEEGRLYDISSIDFAKLRQEFVKSPKKHTLVQNLKNAIERRLALMLSQNPLRTDFQQHYENLIAAYNREKDRLTIEHTFEALLKFVTALDEEQERAVREGLDEPTLALFDLLKKSKLTAAEIKRIKTVATELHAQLQKELARIREWQKKEATRDRVKQMIFDFLYSDETGLPTVYSEEEITVNSNSVFVHFLNQQQYGEVFATL